MGGNVHSTAQTDRLWYALVYEYTQRNLTKTTDRMAALAGIAREFQKTYRPESQYLAGIWSQDLPAALLWICRTGKLEVPSLPDLPTWSWMRLSRLTDHAVYSDDMRLPTSFDFVVDQVNVEQDDTTPGGPFVSCRPGASINGRGYIKRVTLKGVAISPAPCDTAYTCIVDDFTDEERDCFMMVVQSFWCDSSRDGGFGQVPRKIVRTLYLLLEFDPEREQAHRRLGVAQTTWYRDVSDPEDVRQWDLDACLRTGRFGGYIRRHVTLT
jgi:hypothetical protein